MQLCGEHGISEIAYTGNSCPACDQLEELTDTYESKIDTLESDLNDARDEIQSLATELDERNDK